ncbi:uncharacterized protein LOC121744480 [Salvia splendens]|uniref:uncharacterized protein LOC121744480 n=1 Tax=Salvia splendens TaxID=180675 RepID=UPI001C252551|nr:uncharacterized protein LOC121744480 [Salvia splendens]
MKKVITLDDNMFRCDFSIKNYSYSVKRFVGNIVDYTSNASLLLWDREVVQLTGKKVTNVVGSTTERSPMDYIPREVEEQLAGQNVLFKVQLRNSKEYYRNYPYNVIKVCNIP